MSGAPEHETTTPSSSEGGPSSERPAAHNSKVTARDVARRAGVSISAVSRAFTDGASVAPKTRSKVLTASRELGYQPNILARSLMTNRTELIGLITNEFDNPVYLEILFQFTNRLQQKGLRPLVVNLTAGLPPQGALGMLMQYQVDGVIVASSMLHQEFSKACAQAQFPLVQAFGRPVSRFPTSSIGADNVQGGRIAAQMLIQRNYRDIAFLGGPANATSTIDRVGGFREALNAVGLKTAIELYGRSFSYQTGHALMQTILEGRQKIEAVFCGNDVLAMGALDACRKAGVAVPGQIGIIGFDDMPMASWTGYDLTTVRQPVADIIVDAVDLIISMVGKPSRISESRLLPCVGVVRGTLREIGQ